MLDKSIESVFKELNSSNDGLSEVQAASLLKKNGYNELKKQKNKNVILIFLKQLIDPLVYVLLAAFILSLLLKEYGDAFIIIFVVLINSIISTIQEYKAQKALKSLENLTIPKCLVKRDGIIKEIEAKNLVVGDILILQAGSKVSADIRLIETNHLYIDESLLTGESLPVEKKHDILLEDTIALGDQKNKAFMSTNVIKGTGQGIVINTAMNTQVGKIANLIKKEKKDITPLQKKLNEISKVLAIATLLLCGLIFVISILQKRDKLEMLITAISLAVAVIPEGLLAVVTIVLSLGVYRLSKVNSIVKKLPSVETLGCVNVICSDKTGTLTLNQMTVTNLMSDFKIHTNEENIKEKKLFLMAIKHCNDASFTGNNYIGEPTEIALLRYANKYEISKLKRIDSNPFDSNRKMMSTLNDNYQFSKGAIDKILPICKYILVDNKKIILDSNHINKIYELHDKLSLEGLRIIAFSYKETNKINENDMVFLGLVAMIDPPRKEAFEAVEELKNANIKTIMITGDHKNTAFAIAKQLKIADNENQVITGVELDELTNEQLSKNIDKYRVFARVSPENKVSIVNAFQSNGNVVAMTGDGVNDAPSLKKANIGISMGINGTDVCKESSDMILMDDNFATIKKAVKEGRGIFNNIKKTLLFLLSSNTGEVLVMLFAIIFKLPIPLLAIHILWVNLLTDTLPSLALGQDKVNNDVMKEKPRNIKESIFSNNGWLTIIGYGLLIGLISFLSFIYVPVSYLLNNDTELSLKEIVYILENNDYILNKAQTYSFCTLALSQLFHSIGIKNKNITIFSKETFNNKLLLISLVFGIIIQLLVTTIPQLTIIFKTSILNIKEFLIILLFSLIPLVVHEIIILFKRK